MEFLALVLQDSTLTCVVVVLNGQEQETDGGAGRAEKRTEDVLCTWTNSTQGMEIA